MSADRIYPIIALALLAAATLWLERVTTVPEPPEYIARVDPDFIGDNIRTTSFDADGMRRYRLLADQVIHYPHADITDFTRPRLNYSTPDGDVSVTADTGESSADGEVVVLNGNVRVVRERNDEPQPLVLEGSTLTVWPDTQRARSDEPVVVTRGGTIAHGDGMRADNLIGSIDLIGNTRVEMPSQRN